jgi:hypothetical protein
MGRTELAEARHEARTEATFFLLIGLGLLIALGLVSVHERWHLRGDAIGGWLWLLLCVPELILLAFVQASSRMDDHIQVHRTLQGLFGLVVIGNAIGLAVVVLSLLTQKPHGAQLLATAVVVWFTNVIVFGLWFWTLDGGGPVQRALHNRELRDFQFPQDENPQLAASDWYPRLEDYTYIAFTNAIAFSPTDAMPLKRWAKWLMALESALSVVAILVVAARAVNVIGS